MRTTVKAIVAASILLSFYVSAFSQQVAKSIPNSTSPDGVIGFLQFTPSDYGSQKHPLIVFLHGIGERGNGTSQINSVAANAIPKFCAAGASMRFTVNGQTSSFVVLSPQLSVQYGSWPTFYVHEMIKYAKANLQIDTNRIYVCGLSLGGGGVWDVITEAPGGDYSFDGTIAAAAPVCGTQEENDANFCPTIGTNHLPVWAFHSMDDGTVNVGATQHAQILAGWCGETPAAKFTYYQSGGHSGAWINAYDTGHITVPTVVNGNVVNFTQSPNLYEWFLSNSRGTTTPPANTAPVANAGTSTNITLPVSSVNLAGTGTGTNGATISSYAWAQTSGPSTASIGSSTSALATVTGLIQGTYVFTLTVTDNHGLTNSSSVTITVIAAPATSSTTQPFGYIKQSLGSYQACADASSDGRTPIYCSSTANGTIVYLDASLTKIYNGGWDWFSFTPVLGGAVTESFSIFPDGTIHLMSPCSSTTPVTTSPAAGTFLGYIKMSVDPYQACADASSTGRTPVYGSSIANGSLLYTDSAETKALNGGWNWFSITQVLGGSTTYAFGVYPTGGILLLRNCVTGTSVRVASTTTTTAKEDIATLQHLKDSATAAGMLIAKGNKLTMYPNPVHTTATIELTSASDGNKIINLYNESGVLKAKYTWQTVKGYNVFSLKNIPALANGLYIVDIRDTYGKPIGTMKFIKM